MRWIATALSELVGLFVDDLSFTAAILVWIALGAVLLPRLALAGAWAAPLLFLGCAAILVENVRRAARDAPRDAHQSADSARRSQRI